VQCRPVWAAGGGSHAAHLDRSWARLARSGARLR